MLPSVLRIGDATYVKADRLPTADDVVLLKKALPFLLYRGKRKVNYSDQAANWLQGLKPSEAFLYAICEGPWRGNRIEKIRKRVLAIAGKRDLSTLLPQDIEAMGWPLDWQKSRLTSLCRYLQGTGQSMVTFARNLHGLPPDKAMALFYKACGTKSRTKTLDLFARDYLHIDCFPIDRHVRRVLKHFGLPADETFMIKLSYKAKINPRFLARLMVWFAFSGKPFQSAPKKGL